MNNNGDGIGMIQTKGNQIHNNNIEMNTDHGMIGYLCFDDATKNYWGARRPDLFFDWHGNDGDVILTFWIRVFPWRHEPIDIT